MTIDKSKHKYSYIPWEDVTLQCFCGEDININKFYDEDTDCYQAQCKTCGQRWVVVVNYYPVKE